MRLAWILSTSLMLCTADPLWSRQEPAPPTEPPASSQTESTQAPAANATPPAEEQRDSGAPRAKKTPTRKHRKRPATAGEPRKIVVHQGGASEPAAQIMPGMTEEEANRQRQSSEELLAATETNLKRLEGRKINPKQLDTIGQIHYYMDGARSALKDGDTQRAHTLALKAQLLSDDLVGH